MENFPSLRGTPNDSYVYFGSSETQSEQSKSNDYIFPESQGFAPQHFYIHYIREKNAYMLRDLNKGTGTFLKIQHSVILRSGHIVSFGQTHMVIGIMLEKKDTAPPTNLSNSLKPSGGESPLSASAGKEPPGLLGMSPMGLVANSAKATTSAMQNLMMSTSLMIQFIDGPRARQ